MSRNWDSEKQAQFVNSVKQRPILYDRSLAGYNTVLRRLTFKEVGDQFGLSEIEAEKKWKYLRDKYVRESKRVERDKPWDLLPHFQFLEVHLIVAKKTG